MFRRSKAPILVKLCTVALLLASANIALATGQVGEPAADFALTGIDGMSYTRSDYLGNVLYLVFAGYG